jgi:hypothetical protein
MSDNLQSYLTRHKDTEVVLQGGNYSIRLIGQDFVELKGKTVPSVVVVLPFTSIALLMFMDGKIHLSRVS